MKRVNINEQSALQDDTGKLQIKDRVDKGDHKHLKLMNIN